DPLREFADSLRGKGGVEARAAVYQAQRVEIVRGKDLGRWIAAHPEPSSRFHNGAKTPEDQAKEVVELLLRRNLLQRCERMFKRPPPGSKKLVKFPKKLVPPGPGDVKSFAEDAFYAWTYDRPSSPWMLVFTILGMAGVLAACLFPLAPYGIKVTVFYLASGLLTVILGTLVLRLFVAATSWILTGKTLWLLPNVLSEEVPLSGLLKPLVSVQQPDEDKAWANSWLARLSVGVSLASLIFVLYTHSPPKGTVTAEASRYRDELFDLFNIRKEGNARLGNSSASTAFEEAPAVEDVIHDSDL
ncbi:hypothetical protein APUTEX25_003729, partial [Auxenochlorella protothecoides]